MGPYYSLTGITLGTTYTTTAPLNGNIAEVMVFDHALSQSEIESLSIYAAQEYGIGLSIGSLLDSGGTGDSNKNLVQATQSSQPVLVLSDSSYNNRPSLSFNAASNQYLQSGTWASALSDPFTVIVVGNFDGTMTNQYMTDGKAALTVISNYDGTNYYAAIAYAGAFLEGGTNSSAQKVIAAIFNASGSLYVSAKTALATGSTGAGLLDGITLGGNHNGLGQFLNGKIAEVIVYDRALSHTEIITVLGYLGNKYKISVGQ